MSVLSQRRRVQRLPRSGGFTLVEVMVAVLVLLVGLLGVVGMQMLSLQANRGAYFRSQAVYIGSEILDAMRANPSAADDYRGTYPGDGETSSVPATQNCANTDAGCGPQAAAAQDLREWSRHFVDLAPDGGAGAFRPTIPGARAVIGRNGVNEYTVVVTWEERTFDASDDDGSAVRSIVEQSVTLRAVITE